MSNVSDAVEKRLESEPLMAHLATSVDDRPHVAPVWYRYDDGTIEIVTTGRKLANVRENPRVALSIQAAEGGDPEWTVTLLGRATIVDDEAESRQARARIHEKYDADASSYSENVLVRIDVGSASLQTY
ncbi:pyridoxamine 5'-phosphate oxidase family protein [Natrarchaeobaculum aegyptiacum]|uniref:Pyridoxamine 5'-phosphate oxidase n=1 Tax=Natrarchaeobaculum aegyptiacum TaxID=745377 RepID=A0A2Z2I1M1_9EURY|nr:pyridoxamine 5'-phosphate oxidase family protein [Natrarchaeobaculum aegyptiacum]ARS90408.1 pyridoxamine 5'-phosphate oxidase [Natrarchaeobaculum aegyptiacum]